MNPLPQTHWGEKTPRYTGAIGPELRGALWCAERYSSGWFLIDYYRTRCALSRTPTVPLPAGAECFSPELYLCTNYDSRNLTMLPEHPPRLLGVLDLCAVTINRISLSCGLPGQTNYLVPIGCQHVTRGHVFYFWRAAVCRCA